MLYFSDETKPFLETTMLPNPADHPSVTDMVETLSYGKGPVLSNFEQVLFGCRTKMTSFGVIHDEKLYTCAHQWKWTASYFFRHFQREPRNEYELVLNRSLPIVGDDLVITNLGEYARSVPIFPKLVHEFSAGKIISLPQPLPLTCLLDGKVYECQQQIIQSNGKPIGLLPDKSYFGLSSVGFVDEEGRLFLLSGGAGQDYEQTMLVPAWRT